MERAGKIVGKGMRMKKGRERNKKAYEKGREQMKGENRIVRTREGLRRTARDSRGGRGEKGRTISGDG